MTDRRLGTLGALWAAAYLPIHVYWALGGATAPFGIDDPGPDWFVANWAASVLIAGAGLLGAVVMRPWGAVLRGVALLGGGLAIAHWAVFTAQFLMTGPDRWGWWNVLAFEPWFGVMGVLLVAFARRARRRRGDRIGAAVLLAGVGVTVLGVVAFAPWVFLGAGPAVTVAGAGLSYLRTTRGVTTLPVARKGRTPALPTERIPGTCASCLPQPGP